MQKIVSALFELSEFFRRFQKGHYLFSKEFRFMKSRRSGSVALRFPALFAFPDDASIRGIREEGRRNLNGQCLKKGAGALNAPARRKARMEQRRFSNPPQSGQTAVCTRSELCVGCQFPAPGFICWGADGECMKTRINKMKETPNDQNQVKTV